MLSRKIALFTLFLLPLVATAAFGAELPATADVVAVETDAAETVDAGAAETTADAKTAVEERPAPNELELFEPFSPDKFDASCGCRDTCFSDASCAAACDPEPGSCEVVVPQCGCRACVCQSSS